MLHSPKILDHCTSSLYSTPALKAHWPLHSKISHRSKRLRPSKFTPHHKVKAYMPKGFIMEGKSTWTPKWQTMDDVSWFDTNFGRSTSKRWDRCKYCLTMLAKRALNSWYDLWTRFKGPCSYTVTPLGLCVKWPYYCCAMFT